MWTGKFRVLLRELMLLAMALPVARSSGNLAVGLRTLAAGPPSCQAVGSYRGLLPIPRADSNGGGSPYFHKNTTSRNLTAATASI